MLFEFESLKQFSRGIKYLTLVVVEVVIDICEWKSLNNINNSGSLAAAVSLGGKGLGVWRPTSPCSFLGALVHGPLLEPGGLGGRMTESTPWRACEFLFRRKETYGSRRTGSRVGQRFTGILLVAVVLPFNDEEICLDTGCKTQMQQCAFLRFVQFYVSSRQRFPVGSCSLCINNSLQHSCGLCIVRHVHANCTSRTLRF